MDTPSSPALLPSFRSCRPRRGATAVEFALVGSTFFLMVLGIFEMGRVMMVKHLLTNAARHGCRLGTVQGYTNTAIQTAVTNKLTAQGINNATVTVTVNVNDQAGNPSTAASLSEISVKISLPATQVSWLPYSKYALGNLTTIYTGRRE